MTRRPRWLSWAVRGPTDSRTMGRIIGLLKARAPEWNPTALAEVSDRTARDPFRILIACLLSLRTKDETTRPAAERLFGLADPRCSACPVRRLCPRIGVSRSR